MNALHHTFGNSQSSVGVPSKSWLRIAQGQHSRLILKEPPNLILAEIPDLGDLSYGVVTFRSVRHFGQDRFPFKNCAQQRLRKQLTLQTKSFRVTCWYRDPTPNLAQRPRGAYKPAPHTESNVPSVVPGTKTRLRLSTAAPVTEIEPPPQEAGHTSAP